MLLLSIKNVTIVLRNRGNKMNKKNIIMNIIIIICLTLSYWIIDIGIRFLSYDTYQFYSYKSLAPSLFTLGWSSLFIGIYYLIPIKKRKIFYIISIIISNLIALSQYLHFLNLERFYGISDIFLLKEGSKYLGYALLKVDIKILTIILISLTLGLIALKLSKNYHETYRDKLYFTFVIIFTIICTTSLFLCAKFKLGKESIDSYSASLSPLEVYTEFNDPNKNMQVTGLYTSLSRGFKLYINKQLNNNTQELTNEITTYINQNTKTIEKNNYTGIFKDKNLIVILMESIDTFLITEEIMPTLYKLSNEGLNFINRYSPSFGGGQTINSEFALNTSLYTSLEGNIYNYNNTYKTSLANKFKSAGYTANSIHFNSGYYYNRNNFHLNLGYDNHYALADMDLEHDKYNYEYDSNLINDPNVANLIINNDNFLTLITTYSTHLPYNFSNEKCIDVKYRLTVPGNIELTCINNLARDTDEMFRLLIELLDKEQILDDTVLVIASDHYMYGYSKVGAQKNTYNSYLLQHTPLIIWNTNIEAENIDIPVDTADILPTILNLFAIDYDPNLYIGEDAFALNRNNYIYFSEDVYYKDNTLYDAATNPGEKSIYQEIKKTIKFNNNLVESNYLKLETKD